MMKIIKNPQDNELLPVKRTVKKQKILATSNNELLPVKRTVKKQKILATSNSKCYWLFFGKW